MTLWKGSRVDSPNADYFDDFRQPGVKEQGGIFQGSLGAAEFENTQETIGPEGVHVNMSCRLCGRRSDVLLDWEEMFVVGSNQAGLPLLLPAGYQYSDNNGRIYPVNVRCNGKCGGAPLCPQIAPDEARAHVEQGVNLGFVSTGQVEQWRQKVNLYRQRQGVGQR